MQRGSALMERADAEKLPVKQNLELSKQPKLTITARTAGRVDAEATQ